eukprot:scaffold1811_cov411-Prasinococcus_capsulatus_cf.AAC.5
MRQAHPRQKRGKSEEHLGNFGGVVIGGRIPNTDRHTRQAAAATGGGTSPAGTTPRGGYAGAADTRHLPATSVKHVLAQPSWVITAGYGPDAREPKLSSGYGADLPPARTGHNSWSQVVWIGGDADRADGAYSGVPRDSPAAVSAVWGGASA